jgi:hypothetical protein
LNCQSIPPAFAVADREGGSDVAHPGVVGRQFDHSDGVGQHRSRPFDLARRDRHRHRLAFGDRGATSAYAACAGRAPSRQLSVRSGQAIQQPECRAHSAGIR